MIAPMQVTTTFSIEGFRIVVGLRYESSEVGRQGSATEVLCYGTAVVIQPA
jgi:uncharacterized protein YbjQ (UPF0145 family)